VKGLLGDSSREDQKGDEVGVPIGLEREH